MSTLDDCDGCILNRSCPHQEMITEDLKCPCGICLLKMHCHYECYMIRDFLIESNQYKIGRRHG